MRDREETLGCDMMRQFVCDCAATLAPGRVTRADEAEEGLAEEEGRVVSAVDWLVEELPDISPSVRSKRASGFATTGE